MVQTSFAEPTVIPADNPMTAIAANSGTAAIIPSPGGPTDYFPSSRTLIDIEKTRNPDLYNLGPTKGAITPFKEPVTPIYPMPSDTSPRPAAPSPSGNAVATASAVATAIALGQDPAVAIASGVGGVIGGNIGAGIGTVILPGLGTAVGAGIGAGIGSLAGGTLAQNLLNLLAGPSQQPTDYTHPIQGQTYHFPYPVGVRFTDRYGVTGENQTTSITLIYSQGYYYYDLDFGRITAPAQFEFFPFDNKPVPPIFSPSPLLDPTTISIPAPDAFILPTPAPAPTPTPAPVLAPAPEPQPYPFPIPVFLPDPVPAPGPLVPIPAPGPLAPTTTRTAPLPAPSPSGKPATQPQPQPRPVIILPPAPPATRTRNPDCCDPPSQPPTVKIGVKQFSGCATDPFDPTKQIPTYTIEEISVAQGEEDKVKAYFERFYAIESEQCGNQECCVAPIPDSWPVRKFGSPGQLAIVFVQAPDQVIGPKPSYYQLNLPHYSGGKVNVSPIGPYQKGQYYGILTLKDNSKVFVNCISEAECLRVLAQAAAAIDPAMLTGLAPKTGQRGGELLQTYTVYPHKLAWFPNGQNDTRPEWEVKLYPNL